MEVLCHCTLANLWELVKTHLQELPHASVNLLHSLDSHSTTSSQIHHVLRFPSAGLLDSPH